MVRLTRDHDHKASEAVHSTEPGPQVVFTLPNPSSGLLTVGLDSRKPRMWGF